MGPMNQCHQEENMRFVVVILLNKKTTSYFLMAFIPEMDGLHGHALVVSNEE